MISATEADIGRRVIYRTPFQTARGVLAGLYDGGCLVQFGDQGFGNQPPLKVFSNLEWADKR